MKGTINFIAFQLLQLHVHIQAISIGFFCNTSILLVHLIANSQFAIKRTSQLKLDLWYMYMCMLKVVLTYVFYFVALLLIRCVLCALIRNCQSWRSRFIYYWVKLSLACPHLLIRKECQWLCVISLHWEYHCSGSRKLLQSLIKEEEKYL